MSYQNYGPGSPPVVNIGRKKRAAQFIQAFAAGSNSQHFNCAGPNGCGNIPGIQQIFGGRVTNVADNFNQNYYGGSSAANFGGKRKRNIQDLILETRSKRSSHFIQNNAPYDFSFIAQAYPLVPMYQNYGPYRGWGEAFGGNPFQDFAPLTYTTEPFPSPVWSDVVQAPAHETVIPNQIPIVTETVDHLAPVEAESIPVVETSEKTAETVTLDENVTRNLDIKVTNLNFLASFFGHCQHIF